MWDNDRATYQICYHKHFVHLIVLYAGFVAFAEVVFNAIVAAEYHGGYKAKHFFCFYIQGAIGIGGGIEREETFDIGIGRFHYPVVHFGTIGFKVVNEFSHGGYF
jgi:hypothetical protein